MPTPPTEFEQLQHALNEAEGILAELFQEIGAKDYAPQVQPVEDERKTIGAIRLLLADWMRVQMAQEAYRHAFTRFMAAVDERRQEQMRVLEAARGDREKASQAREEAAEERAKASEERAEAMFKFEENADHRTHAQDMRERDAAKREQRAEERALAARERDQAAESRAEAAETRAIKAQEREQKAERRTVAAEAREEKADQREGTIKTLTYWIAFATVVSAFGTCVSARNSARPAASPPAQSVTLTCPSATGTASAPPPPGAPAPALTCGQNDAVDGAINDWPME